MKDAGYDVVAVTSSGGALEQQYSYDPYGKDFAVEDGAGAPLTGPRAIDMAYKGMWLDAETGLYATLARLYDPLTGRWLQRDPYQTALILATALRSYAQTARIFASLRAGAQYGDGMGLYGFARQNPIMYNDPDGQIAPFAVALIAGAVGGVLGAVGGAAGELIAAWWSGSEVDWGRVGRGAVRGGVAGAAAGTIGAATIAWAGISGLAGVVVGGTVEGAVDAGVQGYWEGDRGLALAIDVVGGAILSGVTAGLLGKILGWITPPPATRGIQKVGGRNPINSKYAGGVHPTGVRFKETGFPDFGPHARAEVQLDGLTGAYPIDAPMANRAAGFAETPNGWTWHHVEDGRTMQLVPTDLHDAVRHTGGSAVIRHGEP